jgi:hypothetical protein
MITNFNKLYKIILEGIEKFNPSTIKTVDIYISGRGYLDFSIDPIVKYENPGCGAEEFATKLQKRLRDEIIADVDPEEAKLISKEAWDEELQFFQYKKVICHDAVDIEAGEENSILILGSGCDVWYCIEDIASGKVDDKTFEEFVKFTRSGKIGPHLQTCIMVRKKFNKNTPEDQQTAADLLDI